LILKEADLQCLVGLFEAYFVGGSVRDYLLICLCEANLKKRAMSY
ncbi:CCA-adding enzyme, partial [Listeria seeligeri FSL S4-171]